MFTNISYKKPVTTSNILSGSSENLVDNSISNVTWNAAGPYQSSSFIIDLQQVIQIDKFKIDLLEGCQAFTVSKSNDNINYTPVDNYSTPNIGASYEFSLNITARYIKVHNIRTTDVTINHSIVNFKLYKNLGGAAQVSGLISRNKPVTSPGGFYQGAVTGIVDGVISTVIWIAGGTAAKSQFTIDLGSDATIDKFVINLAYGCQIFKVAVSSNNTDFTLVNTYSTPLTNVEYTFTLTTPVKGRYVKVYDLSVIGNGNNHSLNEFSVYGTFDTTKYLLEKAGQYYKLSAGVPVLTTSQVLSQALFSTEGFDAVSSVILSNLIEDFNLLSFVITPKVLNVNYNPTPTLIKAKGNMTLTFMDQIESFLLTANIAANSNLRIIVSTNDGSTWYTHNGTSWVIISDMSLSNILSNGLTASAVNLLGTSWNDLPDLLTDKKLRFGYCLDKIAATDMLEIQNLQLTYNTIGRFIESDYPDYDIEYGADGSSIKIILTDIGLYKINI